MMITFLLSTSAAATTYPAYTVDEDGNTYEYGVTVIANNETLSYNDVRPPVIFNDNTLIPMRVLFEYMGAEVVWVEDNQSIISNYNGISVKMTIGSNIMIVDGERVQLNVAPMLMQYDQFSDTTMIPLRAVTESFGWIVEWDNETYTVNIYQPSLPTSTPSVQQTPEPGSAWSSDKIQVQSRLDIDKDSCVFIKSDGTVWQGKMSENIFSKVDGLSNVIAVANARTAYYALTTDGYVYSWGSTNESGQLGRTDDEISSAVRIEGLDNIIKIDAGISYGLALSKDGRLYTWGRNEKGQIGNGTLEPVSKPTEVNVGKLIDAAAGPGHIVAVTTNGTVYTWGENSYGQLGRGAENSKYHHTPGIIKTMFRIKSVYAGYTTSAAIRADNSVYMWGTTYIGELGEDEVPVRLEDKYDLESDEDGYYRYEKPLRMRYYYYDYSLREAFTGVLQPTQTVSCGEYQAASITNGKVYMWGDSPKLKLNYKSQIERFCAQEYTNLENVIGIYADVDKTIYALDSNNCVWRLLYNNKEEMFNIR